MIGKKGKIKKFTSSEEALTEVVDFTITLGIMLLALGVIGVYGYPMLEHMKDAGHLENIEQSFSVLKPNMNKVVYGKAPSQSVELKMHGGSVAVTGTSYMNITMRAWNESSSSEEEVSIERQLRMIQNDFVDTSIAYENTGAWAKYPRGSAIAISKPDFAYDGNTLVIPVVTISGSKSMSGSSLIRIIADGGQLSISRYENVSNVNITIMSEYYNGWERYLSDSIGMQILDVDANNNTFTAGRSFSPNIDVITTMSPMSVTIE
ncbi:MAG: hypothetical protein SCH66_01730 [Methanolobus sp.]|nr:hypothetical protein [Methanolobus sp.]